MRRQYLARLAERPLASAAALLSPRADFDDWADHPRRFLEHAREIGAIHDRNFPPSVKKKLGYNLVDLYAPVVLRP